MVQYTPSLTHPRPQTNQTQTLAKNLAGGIERLSDSFLPVFSATITGRKTDNATDNAADVYVGFSEAHQPILLSPGATITIKAGDDNYSNDLNQIFVNGTADDGVIVNYSGPTP